MKISILGGGSVGLSTALIALLSTHHKVSIVDSVDERIVMCGHPLANIVIDPFPVAVQIPDRCNAFRGGSRGKGGKIKYKRG
jgi:threonine dehydrogenase-like Zn-dependent dehydrogenase